MEIRQFQKESLSDELKAFVLKLMYELWAIEEPYLKEFASKHDSIEGLINTCYDFLDVVLVGFVDNEPVGFIANHTHSYNEITKLVVASEHKRKGYGSCLVSALCLTMETWLEAIIIPSNENAVKFYKAEGFVLTEHKCESHKYLIGTIDKELQHA